MIPMNPFGACGWPLVMSRRRPVPVTASNVNRVGWFVPLAQAMCTPVAGRQRCPSKIDRLVDAMQLHLAALSRKPACGSNVVQRRPVRET